MNDPLLHSWRERIESELREPKTYEDLGLTVGPGIHIEPIHVRAPDGSGTHDVRLEPVRYEPLVRSADEFRMLRSIDPDVAGPALVNVSSPTGALGDVGAADFNVRLSPEAGSEAVSDLLARAVRNDSPASIGLLVDPLALACFGRDADVRRARTDAEPLRTRQLEIGARHGTPDAAIGCVDALAAEEAGAAPATMVAWTLFSLSLWLDALDPDDLYPDDLDPDGPAPDAPPMSGRARRIRILAPVGNRLIVDAAVLTSIRDLSARLVRAYAAENGGPERPLPPILHAVSSRNGIVRSTAPADDAGNLVRATLQAVAASCAGAEILSLLPYDAHREPTPDTLRYSAGIHRLLRHESRLGVTALPFAGSYAFETIVRKVSDEAWSRFIELTSGGTGLLDDWLRSDRASGSHPVRVGLDRYVPDLEAEMS